MQIDPGATIICANVRLAHHFKRRYSQEQLRQGRRAWETPDILPWQAWLRRCWESHADRDGVLLSGEQEQVLWQQIIEESRHKDRFLQIASVAEQAAAAWQRLKQYRVPVFPEGVFINEDADAFCSWADVRQRRCRENNWIDQATLPDRLSALAETDPALFGADLTLAGFDVLTPQQNLFRERLQVAGIAVREYPLQDRNESALTANFADLNEEIRAAAVWARRLVEADRATSIAIVTPGLRKFSNRIRYILEDVLAPGNLRYGNEARALPFSIALGQTLTDYPLIHAALHILELSGDAPPTLETLSVLLRTPFIKGHEQERGGRALLDEKLHADGLMACSWNELLALAHDAGARGGRPVPVLAGLLRTLHSTLEQAPARQTPEAWVADFTRLLDICGWPGERGLNSAEYQQAESWRARLDALVSLRLVRPSLSRPEALSHLRRIVAATRFQPETPETPIQVLEPQGVAAMDFDHIRMLGLSEESWPLRARPNPFIPIALQKQLEMPEADAELMLRQCERLQQTLTRATRHIILSHARQDGDRPLARSPLLRGLPEHEAEKPEPETAYSHIIFTSKKIDTVNDSMAPPVSGRQRGGASLFKDQSQCPFRAFAKHRLHSRELQQTDIGLDAMRRGNLLHALLYKTWSGLEGREQLAAMDEPALEALIETRVSETIAEQRRRYPLIFTRGFCAIETERLTRLLREWLELELQRAAFAIVSLEEKAEFAVADIEFSARLDRVDELPNGCRVIIDYKSGATGVSSWKGDRPDDPQLPLYAITHDKPVAAVTFARLKPGGDLGFDGLAETETVLPGIGAFEQQRRALDFISSEDAQAGQEAPTWKRLLSHWRIVLAALGDEFRQGVATVRPKPRACDWCDQRPLCRIHERNAAERTA